MRVIKVGNFWAGLTVAALAVGDALAASPRSVDDGISNAHALPIGLGVLLLAAMVFRRRRGRN